jgi:putative heme-binding domain-containing protein
MPASERARFVGAGKKVGSLLDGLLAEARATAADGKQPAAARTAAIRSLRFVGFTGAEPLLTELIDLKQPPEVQSAAIETFAAFDDARVAALLLQRWPAMSPGSRETATEALFSRPAWIRAFLDAVEKGAVSRADIDPARLDLLRNYPDQAVKARAAKLFTTTLPQRQTVVAAYQDALKRKGDRDRGKALFKTNCATCHRLESVGQEVGADLSAIRDRGLEAVLLNILDPNRDVKPQYLSYVLVTTDGRILTGMIRAETTNSMTLRKPDGAEETVLRRDIDELRSTGLSFMPEGLEKQLDVAAMADLLAYLGSIGKP